MTPHRPLQVAKQPGNSLKNDLLKQLDAADIAVMGSMELSNFEKNVHLGSMAQAVARQSTAHVMIVKNYTATGVKAADCRQLRAGCVVDCVPGRLGSAEQSKALPHTAWERRYARHDGMTADVLGLGVYRKAVFNGVRVARVSCMRRACARKKRQSLLVYHSCSSPSPSSIAPSLPTSVRFFFY